MYETDLSELTIAKLSSLLQNKEVSPVEITQAILERISRLNPKINVYITIFEEHAMEKAKIAEKEIINGNYKGLLHGIPVAVKDNFEVKGFKTTCASKVRENHISTFNATIINRLQQAGAILIGKLNMQEFAIGATSTDSHFGPVRNPWDTSRIPGGSSGGSAAAISSSLALGTLGSDTRGSGRIPASLCGIVGLKPTYGLASNYGITPVAWSLDHPAPMTRTVEDVAIMLQAIAGYDPNDPSTVNIGLPDYQAAMRKDIKGLKLALPVNYFFDEIEPEVEKVFKETLRVFVGLGASVEEITIPEIEFVPVAGSYISPAEQFTYHEKYIRNHFQDYSSNVRERILTGSVILATDYIKSQQYRNLLRRNVHKILERFDALLTPTTAATAPKIGGGSVKIGGREKNVLKLLSLFTAPWNLTGQPAISVACGFGPNNMPVGLQIVGRCFDEETIIRVANAYEISTSWHEKRPEL
jgi:aspartyl-tRNA(Asn)/glutamyl-tRNA(Gln) amidotransferase subunit A